MNNNGNFEENIYLDNNATTAIDPLVLDAMMPYLTDNFGNPSSVHSHGQKTRSALDIARMQVASLINADPEEIIFTSGGTEANNTAIFGHLAARNTKEAAILISAVEHHAVLYPGQHLEQTGKAALHFLEVDENGAVRTDQFKQMLDSNKITITSIMMANNDVGTVQPINELADEAQKRGVTFHTDAVQAAGKIPIDVKKTPVSMLSIASHKIYGPKGVGSLYVRRGTRLSPLLFGGHQEARKRAGTESIPNIVGFGKACELAKQRLGSDFSRISDMRSAFEKSASSINGVLVHGSGAERLAGTSYISCEGVEGETLVMAMDMHGISISTGSACNSESKDPSPVLVAMGVPAATARSSIRISIGRNNTPDEIEKALAVLKAQLDRIRDK